MKRTVKSRFLMMNCVLPLLIGAACSKSAPPKQQVQMALPDKAAEARAEQREAAWTKIQECFADEDRKSQNWADAWNATLDLKSECAVQFMWNRHQALLVSKCLSLIETADAQGLADERFKKKQSDVTRFLNHLKATTEAGSRDMKKCKKWAAALLAQPIHEPPALSISEDLCPSSPQVLRDAQGRYDGVCMYMGNCSMHLGVVSRTPDPYDHSRCDTAVKAGRGGPTISALYRRSGGDWQLVDIH